MVSWMLMSSTLPDVTGDLDLVPDPERGDEDGDDAGDHVLQRAFERETDADREQAKPRYDPTQGGSGGYNEKDRTAHH